MENWGKCRNGHFLTVRHNQIKIIKYNVPILLGPNENLPKTVRDTIQSAVFDYIIKTSSNIMI